MLEILQQRGSSELHEGPTPGLVMAMDFDTGFKDLFVPSRVFTGAGSTVLVDTAQKKNGKQSYLHVQPLNGQGPSLQTPRSADLTFNGDFWIEMWGYCLGQGSPTFTGGYNCLFTYGKFASSGLQGLALENSKLGFKIPNGTGIGTLVESSILAVNNAWQHFSVGRKNGVIYLFLNGKVVASAPYAAIVGIDTTVSIGGMYDDRAGGSAYAGFNGYIDRVRVYNQCQHITDFTPAITIY